MAKGPTDEDMALVVIRLAQRAQDFLRQYHTNGFQIHRSTARALRDAAVTLAQTHPTETAREAVVTMMATAARLGDAHTGKVTMNPHQDGPDRQTWDDAYAAA